MNNQTLKLKIENIFQISFSLKILQKYNAKQKRFYQILKEQSHSIKIQALTKNFDFIAPSIIPSCSIFSPILYILLS